MARKMPIQISRVKNTALLNHYQLLLSDKRCMTRANVTLIKEMNKHVLRLMGRLRLISETIYELLIKISQKKLLLHKS